MNMKKSLAMLLAVTMVLVTMAVPAFAAESWNPETPVTTVEEFVQACADISAANGEKGKAKVLLGANIILTENVSVGIGGSLYFGGNGYQVYGNGNTLSFTATDAYTALVSAGKDVTVSAPSGSWGWGEYNDNPGTGGVVMAYTSEPIAAEINGVYYNSLDQAVKAAKENDVVKLLADQKLTDTLIIANTAPITIDFGGYYIDVTAVSVENHGVSVEQGANVTFMGQGGIKGNKNCVNNAGTVTFNGGTYTSKLLGRGSALRNEATGVMTVNDGVVVDAYYFGLANEGGTVTLNGGMIESHARTGLDPANPYTYAYTVKNAGNMDVYEGVTVKGIQGAFAASGYGVTNIYGGKFFTHEDEEGSAGRSHYACYAANYADVTIWGGSFTAADKAAVYVGNEDTGKDGANVKIKGGTFVSNGGATAAVIQTNIKGSLNITGGTFSSDVSRHVAKGYYLESNPDGTFTVQKAAAEVIDTAKTPGAEITLEGLGQNDAVDLTEDATYQVVVATAPAADAAAANAAIEANTADTNADKMIFDVSVVKIDSAGTKTDVSDEVMNQKVSIALAETPAEGTKVYVYHVNDQGTAEQINGVAVTGNIVTFTAPSFSTYAVTYTAKAAAEEDVTGKIGVVFSPVSEGGNQYNITLKSLEDGKKINRFMAADLVFKNDGTGVTYEILPAANVNVSAAAVNGNSTEYHFELNGTAASSVSGDAITIGTVEFGGYGSLNFSIDKAFSSGHAVNIVNTAKVNDSIVSDYTVEGDTLVVNEAISGQPNVEAGESGVITGGLKPAQQTLTVNVAFPNGVAENEIAYQDMKATVSGGDLTENIVLNFGSDGVAMKDGGYSFTQELTQNVSYTVTLEGAGYRTVRYTVNMNSDKTLNFWNNVKDEATVVEVGKDASAVKTTFLAGDIVKDNIINLYDLSAVVSYFGTENLAADYPAYAKYDLNRDGKIDSKDVAMVLVSWGN